MVTGAAGQTSALDVLVGAAMLHARGKMQAPQPRTTVLTRRKEVQFALYFAITVWAANNAVISAQQFLTIVADHLSSRCNVTVRVMFLKEQTSIPLSRGRRVLGGGTMEL